jgi:uncharacterized protein YfbU (UPF0304 family)
MKTFKLNMYEMIDILDKLNQNAYDKLQSALEQKICKDMTEEQWLDIWQSEGYEIEMTIKLKDNKK